jgi:hypothetical protein
LKPSDHRDLLTVDPKPNGTYEQFSLVHLTAYSIHWLDQWQIPTTYENIGVLNSRLFPSRFSLPGFPEMPDMVVTNRSILQMRPKYRGFAVSDPRKGVHLTEKGREGAAKVQETLGPPRLQGQASEVGEETHRLTQKDKKRTRDPQRIITECKDKLLFRRYKEGRFEDTDVVHLLGLISLHDHTPPKGLRDKLTELEEDAQAISDEEFIGFLHDIRGRFATYLNRDKLKEA